MLTTVFVACADDGIGRFDRSTLSQQSLMELFVFGIDKAEKICHSRESPAEVCQWKGASCNAGGEITALKWSYASENGSGTVELKYLPSSMKELAMMYNALTGTITLGDLPDSMETLYLCGNHLTGRLDLDSLPAAMQHVDLSDNAFTGEISIEHLPNGLKNLYLCENQLSGPVCFTSLPPAFVNLDLSTNHFEGPLDLTRLPVSMEVLHVHKNGFAGIARLGRMPPKLKRLIAMNNKLTGTVRVSDGCPSVFPENKTCKFCDEIPLTKEEGYVIREGSSRIALNVNTYLDFLR